MWDATATLNWIPKKYFAWWRETGYRYSDVPYWSGRGGITPPGGNNGAPSQYACANGSPSGQTYGNLQAAAAFCAGPGANPATALWWPDLRKGQANTTLAIKVRF